MSATSDPPVRSLPLRDAVLRFLALHVRPGAWTFYTGAQPAPGAALPGGGPDLVIEVGGRVVYVEVRAPGRGPLPAGRRAWMAAARCRGADTAMVRSVPDAERLLAELGVRLRRLGRLADDTAGTRDRRRSGHDENQNRAHEAGNGASGRRSGPAHAADRRPPAP